MRQCIESCLGSERQLQSATLAATCAWTSVKLLQDSLVHDLLVLSVKTPKIRSPCTCGDRLDEQSFQDCPPSSILFISHVAGVSILLARWPITVTTPKCLDEYECCCRPKQTLGLATSTS